tara:strand:+ start:762 stop:1217 length:456 start_codon:yes stop_codon:yes gene_type:complete
MQIEEFFIDLVVENSFNDFVYLIESGKVDPSYDNHLALVIAVEENKYNFVKYLLNLNLNISHLNHLLFQQTIEYNSDLVLPLLLKDRRFSVEDNNFYPLRFALKHQNINFVKLLLEEKDIKDNINLEWISLNIKNKKELNIINSFYKVLLF